MKTALNIDRRSKIKDQSLNLKHKVFRRGLTGILLFFLFLGSARATEAQTFTLSPSSVTKTVGEQWTVSINIDTAGKAVKGADVKLTYDETLVEVVSVSNGEFFPKGGYNANAGILYLSYGFDQALQTKTGSGTFATLTLKGKSTGTASFAWACSAQPSDTNIWDSQSNDIVTCSSLRNGTYTIIQGGSSSATATPTSAAATATPPVSGEIGPTFWAIGAGIMLTIVGLALTI
jgi:hypothetical protein